MSSNNISIVRLAVLFLVLIFQIRNTVTGFGVPNFAPRNDPVIQLSRLNINPGTVTLSGFSAGSSMATQFHVAHSSLFSGVALFSQAFYRCGPGSLIEFGIRCSTSGYQIFPYNVNTAIRDARWYEFHGLVDPLRNLAHQKVFVWTGSLDEYLPERSVVQNRDFYSAFISNPAQITVKVEEAKHLFPTTNFGAGCKENAESNYYLGNCSYSGAYHSLRFLLGSDNLVLPTEGFDLNQLKVFNQSEFHAEGNITKAAMGTLAHIYIPRKCETGQAVCHLHVNFHGCNEWPLDVSRNYILNSEFLPLAEENNIILLFPITTSVPANMNGCWDFFSYTGKKFATKDGEQIKVAYAMVQRLLNGV